LALVIAHRTFAPRLWSTVGALALIATFIALGRWQLARADYKRQLFAEFAAGSDATLSLAAADSKSLPRYQHVAASGHFDYDGFESKIDLRAGLDKLVAWRGETKRRSKKKA